MCDPCWEAVPRWIGLSCVVCGVPLPDGGARCRDCRRRRRAFRFLRSAGLYEGSLMKLIRKFKYGGREDLARPLGRLMADRWAEEPRLGPADAVLPVPLHWIRERTRGYNQAAVLAGIFAEKAGLPLWEGVLKRDRSTKQQTALGRAGREANVRDAFRVARPERVKGKTLILVDDVSTTGATLESCARVLRQAGARRVGALTAARQVAF